MKQLTRLQMINWHYFNNQIISFKDINFLTGDNSSGKSTIIDAIQAGLLGETRSVKFNRAAGKKSERTLRSYLIGTLGEDVSAGVRALRDGKDFSSYVVTEFYDDVKDCYFCIGMVADIYCDGGDERKRWFVLDDKLPSSQMIVNGKTTDSSSFIKWCKQNYSTSKFQSFDTVKSFNDRVLQRTRVFDKKLFSLLQKAISFEPITNIEEFITTNVCDIEANIDTLGMQEDIRNYQFTEQQAQKMEQRLDSVEKICKKYDEVQTHRARKKLQQFFIDYGCYCAENNFLKEDIIAAESKSSEIEGYTKQLRELNLESEKLREEENELILEKGRFLSESKKELLEKDKKETEKDIAAAHNDKNSLIRVVNDHAYEWAGKCAAALAEIDNKADNEALKYLKSLLEKLIGFSEKSLDETSVKFFSDIKEHYNEVNPVVQSILYRLRSSENDIKIEKELLTKQIENLKNGIKPYPDKAVRLKEAISKGISDKYGHEVNVDFLADLTDVTDNEWKNAVEGLLGNDRMNIIVSPEYFMDAYYIYKRVHNSLGVHEYSVVDLEKVFNDKHAVLTDSLAQIVSCSDKYVQAYLDFLLGRVIRCYDDERIRDNRISVTKDCMLYRNYAIKPINPFHYKTPYIGQKSIEIQLKQKEELLVIINDRMAEVSNKIRNIRTFCDSEWFINQNFLDYTAVPAYKAYSLLPELNSKLRKIEEKLSLIDYDKLSEIEKKIKYNKDLQNENEENKNDVIRKQTTAENKFNDITERSIPEHERKISEQKSLLAEHYDEDYTEKTAKPEFDKRLSQYGSPAAVASAFDSPLKQTQTILGNAEDALRKLRSDYNSDFPVSFNIFSFDNDEYENEYKKIKEIDLPSYKDRIIKAKETAMESFRNDFLNKLQSHILTVIEQIKDLNKALSNARFGNNTYKFEYKPNPEYLDYYNMIMDAEPGETLFSYDFNMKYKDTIENLFAQLDIDSDSDSAAAEKADKLSRYSTYLTFDLLSIDSNGITERLSRTISSKSGGEIQTPFYVAMLASFAQLYKVNDTRNQTDNTMRLVIFDEAFNKMDSERITESIAILREFGLQAIICSPSEKAGDIVPLCDKTLLVDKQNDGNGGYRSTVVEWTKDMGEIK